ncbi:MAG: hypothetical protein FWG39_02110 [Alphaproteobacteria bacterium]|nr:hypothetical protein [Alphaproteobacteria bacterium]
MNLSREIFFDLERRLKDAGLDSDSDTFDVIKKRLCAYEILGPDDFAAQAVYVVLAGGFSQKTAKLKHAEIMGFIVESRKSKVGSDCLLKIFNNKNKVNAIIKIWENREKYCAEYYKISGLDSKLSYLATLPHIGKITANHLARNLGENIVKYDIWIQRLGVAFVGANCVRPGVCNTPLQDKVNNGKLDPEIKSACDAMFVHLERETGLPRGYIDVVLWKSCQNHLIEGV